MRYIAIGIPCSNIVEYCFRNFLPRFHSVHGVKFRRFLSLYPDFPVFRKLVAILDTISRSVNIWCPTGCVVLQRQRRFRITFAASLPRNALFTWRESEKKWAVARQNGSHSLALIALSCILKTRENSTRPNIGCVRSKRRLCSRAETNVYNGRQKLPIRLARERNASFFLSRKFTEPITG